MYCHATHNRKAIVLYSCSVRVTLTPPRCRIVRSGAAPSNEFQHSGLRDDWNSPTHCRVTRSDTLKANAHVVHFLIRQLQPSRPAHSLLPRPQICDSSRFDPTCLHERARQDEAVVQRISTLRIARRLEQLHSVSSHEPKISKQCVVSHHVSTEA